MWLTGGFCLLAVASALVARAAARRARALLRELRGDLDYLLADQERLRVQFARLEGRQTARLHRAKPDETASDDGLPDPNRDPEKWRAAVRLLGLKKSKQGELQ